MQVLKEPSKAAGSRLYMWVYRSGNDGLAPILLLKYRPGRNGEYAEKFLGDFHIQPAVQSDLVRLLSTRAAHVCGGHPETVAAGEPPTLAQQGRSYYGQLFAKGNEIVKPEPEQRQKAHLEEDGPFLGLLGAGWMNFQPSR